MNKKIIKTSTAALLAAGVMSAAHADVTFGSTVGQMVAKGEKVSNHLPDPEGCPPCGKGAVVHRSFVETPEQADKYLVGAFDSLI